MENKVIIVAVVALFALAVSSGNLTGFVPKSDSVSSLSAVQEGSRITVAINPIGKSGNPGKLVDMVIVGGVKKESSKTICDRSGPKSGKAECNKEIATFNIAGSKWNAGDRVQFTIRGTDITSPVMVLR